MVMVRAGGNTPFSSQVGLTRDDVVINPDLDRNLIYLPDLMALIQFGGPRQSDRATGTAYGTLRNTDCCISNFKAGVTINFTS